MYNNVHMPVMTLQKATVKHSGVCSIKLIKWEEVLTFPMVDPLIGIISSALELIPGAVIYSLPSIDQARSFNEEEKDSSAGAFFDINVKVELPGSNASNILSLQTMRFHQWVIIVEDRNGVTRLVGDKDSGARLLQKYTSGDAKNSRKTEVVFAWEHELPAPIYTAAGFDITIGGVTHTAGSITFIMKFRVGDPGAPMAEPDTTLTRAAFANKRLLITADGISLDCDDGSGDIDWTGLLNRHYEKTLASDTVTFVGGVSNTEIIAIYAIN